jgi:hypothetical protein
LSPRTRSVARGRGVIDSPIPLVGGLKVKTVFIVPGVSAGFSDFETQFLCTSLDTKAITVAIEVFDDSGGGPQNDVTADNGVDAIGVGETSAFETNDIPSFESDEHIDTVAANSGSARILSTSSKVACTALIVAGASLTPPTSMTNLQVIKKSQKGD